MKILNKDQQSLKTAAIYTRVSTDEQKESGFSLQDQHNKLVNFCNKNGYEIIEHYQDDHSAKTFNRPQFQRFLQDVKTKKIKIDAFICVRPDRFSRNLENTLLMLSEFKKLKVNFVTVENHTELDTPESYLPFIVHNLLPQIENERRAINTKQGMRQALKEGRWMWKAPIGYKNNKITKELEIDHDVAPYIIAGFKEISTGAHSVDEVRKRLIKKGMKKCAKQTFLNLIRNSIYCGKIKIDAWKDEEEQIVRGKHPPVISEELFYEVQNVINGKKKNFPNQITQNENLELRGHLICRVCGNKLTGSGSLSRNKSKHYYYHCQKGCKERFRADNANKSFKEYLSTFEIPENILQLYHMTLQDVFKQDDAEKAIQVKELDKKIDVIKQRSNSISEKMMDDLISTVEYKKLKANLDEEENELIWKRTELGMDYSAFKKYFDYGLAFLHNLKGYYQKADLSAKSKIIGSIFPEKLVFEENKYRTTKSNELLTLLTSNINDFGGIENNKAGISAGSSRFAPPSGLEPETL